MVIGDWIPSFAPGSIYHCQALLDGLGLAKGFCLKTDSPRNGSPPDALFAKN